MSPLHQVPLPTGRSQPGTGRHETPLRGSLAGGLPNSLLSSLGTALESKILLPNLPCFLLSITQGQTCTAVS